MRIFKAYSGLGEWKLSTKSLKSFSGMESDQGVGYVNEMSVMLDLKTCFLRDVYMYHNQK